MILCPSSLETKNEHANVQRMSGIHFYRVRVISWADK